MSLADQGTPSALTQPLPPPNPGLTPQCSKAQLKWCYYKERGKEERLQSWREKNVASLQHDVTLTAFRSPNTEQKQTTWTPDLLCLERFVFSAAPSSLHQLKKANSQTDRSLLQHPGPQSEAWA